jgi:hypothetical protein
LWEDSPEGWPQRWDSQGGQFQQDGRPASQWSRIRAGRDDDLGPLPDGTDFRPDPDWPALRLADNIDFPLHRAEGGSI